MYIVSVYALLPVMWRIGLLVAIIVWAMYASALVCVHACKSLTFLCLLCLSELFVPVHLWHPTVPDVCPLVESLLQPANKDLQWRSLVLHVAVVPRGGVLLPTHWEWGPAHLLPMVGDVCMCVEDNNPYMLPVLWTILDKRVYACKAWWCTCSWLLQRGVCKSGPIHVITLSSDF